MKFFALFFCLCFALIITSASTFEISKSDLVLVNSKLDGVELISARPVFSTANTTHTTHFFYIITKNEEAKESLLSITPVGFKLKKTNVISTNTTEYIKTIDYVEEKEIIKNETYYDIEYIVDDLNSSITKEKNISKTRQYSELIFVNKTKNVSTINFSLDNTKIGNNIKSNAGSYFIEIVTGFGESGSFNPDVSACAELNETNGIYNLTQNVSIDGATCFTVSAENVTLDCQGFSITGFGNTLSTYGVYTNQYNTTIKNCNIHNFDASVRLSGTYGVVKDSNITTNYTASGYGRAILVSGSNNIVHNVYAYGYKGGGTYSVPLIGDNNTIANSTVVGNSSIAMRMEAKNSRVINVTVLAYSTYGIYHTAGSNLSVDCMGVSITGSNTSGSYGVYSTQPNTTVKNCNISNFSSGVYFNGADNGTIDNVTTNTTYACSAPNGIGIYLYDNANYNTIANSNGYSESGYGIYIVSSNYNSILNFTGASGKERGIYLQTSSNNSIINSTGTAGTNYGIVIQTGFNNSIINSTGTAGTQGGICLSTNSNCNSIINSTGTAVTVGGILLVTSSNNSIINSTGTSVGFGGIYLQKSSNNNTIINSTGTSINSYRGIFIYSDSNYNTIINSTGIANQEAGIQIHSSSNNSIINSTATSGAYGGIYISTSSNNNSIINSTFNSTEDTVRITSDSGTNTFYYNNITGSVWVNDTNGTNIYNTTGIGNIYYFANGTPSWEVYSIYTNDSDNWADYGVNRPFNSSIAEWLGSGEDWHPYTLNTNHSIIITQNVSFTNATVGHWFYANASAYNLGGYNQSHNITYTQGVCTLLNSTESNWTLAVVYNCTAQTPSTTSINITFYDVYGVRNSTQANNSYQDPNMPVLSAPFINGTASVGYTLTCNAGNFSDADGDIENVTATTWRWFNGTTPIANATSQTWLVPLWYNGAVIKCEQNITAQNWTTSQASNNSSAVNISNANPVNATLDNMINATTSHQFNITAYVDDADGGADITVWNLTSTHGTCAFLSNATNGTRFTVLINCYAQSEGTTELNITFADFNGLYNWTAKNFTYIDHEANLSAPFITPISNNSAENLTCNLGNWSDIDGDIENTSARSFRWFVNGIDINVSEQVLASGNFTTGNYVACEQFSQAQNWTTSNYTINSSEVYISNQSVNLVIVSPTNASLINSCNFTALIFTGFQNGTTGRTATCNLSYDGQFITTQTKNVSNGFSTFIFYNLTNNGNYSLTCQAQDSFSVSQVVSVHTQYYDMTACYADFYKKTSNTTTTFLYSKFEIEYFNVSEVLGVMLLGLAMFGMVSYATRLRKGNILTTQQN